MPTVLEIASLTFGFCRKIYCWARADVKRWWKSWIAKKLFSSKISNKGNAMLPVTGFATASQMVNRCQLSCYITKFCYTWVNKCDVTKLCHKYYWPVEIQVTSSAIPYLKSIYPIRTWGLPLRLGPGPPTI